MNKLKEYELSLLEEDLERLEEELDMLAPQESDKHQELVKMKKIVINDIEKLSLELLPPKKRKVLPYDQI